MKHIRLLMFAVVLVVAGHPHHSVAQVGPGGVGTLTNTQLWLRSDSLIAIKPLYYVTGWLDQSGHMRDFGAVVMGQTVPSLTLDALNGYPAVTFDNHGGVGGDFLGYIGSLGISGTDAASVVIVARNMTAADEQNGGLYLGQRNVGGADAVRSYGIEHTAAVRFNGRSQLFSDGYRYGEWTIIYYSNRPGAAVADYRAWINGTPMAASSASSFIPSLVSNYALLGATQHNGLFNPQGYFHGDMMEVALFSGELNDAERVVLHNNLGAKYMIPVADDHYTWKPSHSHDVTGIAAYNGTIFTNAWSAGMLALSSPDDLDEGEYLFFGHDGGTVKSWISDRVPAPGTRRLERAWRFDETGEVGTVTITVPAASLPPLPGGYPMVGILTGDDGDFSSGTVMLRTTLAGGYYTTQADIVSGQHLAIAAFRPEVNFRVTEASGPESNTSVTVEAFLNYPHTEDIAFSYAPAGGTATPGSDYLLAPGTITIPAGSVTGSFTITVIDDHLVEPSETIIISLSDPSPGLSLGDDDHFTYTIIDNDFVYASFSSAVASGAEGDTPGGVASPEIIISGGIIGEGGSVTVSVTNGTTSDDDWSQSASLITIPPGDYTTPYSFPLPPAALTIVGDLVVEPDETLLLELTGFVTVTPGAVVNAVYTILNDDDAIVAVTTPTPLIAEGGPGPAGSGTFIFTFSSPVSDDRTVSYSVGGTATAGDDYVALPGSFVMRAGEQTHTITLTAVADLMAEGDETVVVTLTGVSGVPLIVADPSPAIITIEDDDLPEILWSPPEVTIVEGTGSTLEVWLGTAPSGPVTVDLTPLRPELLTLLPVSLTFTPSDYSSHRIITVHATDNQLLGDNRDTIIISVDASLTQGIYSLLADHRVPVAITDDDIAAIIAVPSAVTVEENGTATFSVTLSAGPPSGVVVVDLASNNSSVATIDTDQLIFTPSDFNIPRIITVTGTDNNTLADEVTTISLVVNDLLSYVGYHGVTATVTVNVLNDDVAGFVISPGTLTIDEGGPAGEFSIVLTARPLTEVVFDLVNVAPVHLIHQPRITITPDNWDVPHPVTVAAIDDDLDMERIDTISVAVSELLSDASFRPLPPQEVIVFIHDDDPPVITGCPSDITVSSLAGACHAVVVWEPPLSTAPMVSTHEPGTTFATGVTTVTYTSTDADGLVSHCSFTVTVNDDEPPVVSCRDITVELDATGNVSIVPDQLLLSPVTDNCAVASVTLSRSSFTCDDLGVVNVTVTATDASGNSAHCSAEVTVTDPFIKSLSAGPDAEICITDPHYTLAGASAENVTLLWSSSGSGTFSDPTLINPAYFRGEDDGDEVTLTVTGTSLNGCDVTLHDSMVLTFAGLPVAHAGADRDLCQGTPTVVLDDAYAANGSLTWSTSGNGTFSDPSAAHPVYTFGSADSGPVTLTMSVTSPLCGSVTDEVVITFTTAPRADAGPDGSACHDAAGYQVAGASHGGGLVLWSSSGDGSFDDSSHDNPWYSFGAGDRLNGMVTLTMTVSGGGTCGTASSSAVITLTDLPVVTVVTHNEVTCAGLTDGSVRLTATGGMAPYMFSIDGGTPRLSGHFSGLAPGSYLFEVHDALGCRTDTLLTIAEPLPFTAVVESLSDVTCHGAADGAIHVALTGGTEPYDIRWSGPEGWEGTTATITDLAAGTYILTVTDRYGCASYSFIEVISEPDAIEVTGVLLSDYRGYGVSCPGLADGSITVTLRGGTAPLLTRWSGPGGFTSDDLTITLLHAGDYTLTVTDSRGCTLTSSYRLTSPETPDISGTVTDAACPDTHDGSIVIAITGGQGPHSYLWSDGVTTASRTGLDAGSYQLEVTDAFGCRYTYQTDIGVTGYNCLTVYEIITPNGDGVNDTWKIRNAELYPQAELFVYTRWGRLVYHSRNLTNEWDGTYNGKLLPNDSYHYVIHLNDGSAPRTGVISIISR